MGKLLRCTVAAFVGLGAVAGVSACTSSEPDPVPVDLDATDLISWTDSVLGERDGMSLSSRHEGPGQSGGSFYDAAAGWYAVEMVCVGGNGMTLHIEADGEPVGNGSTDCNSFSVTAYIELLEPANRVDLEVTNSGEQMLWAVQLTPGPPPSVPPEASG
ncbi:hypothetical protein BJ994_002487 [Arthrobacter pigmenti]|uniref:Lipoprotein n=1 Tax=Arthrobacter pigmenti TaxID=271432 RepID=A0A846RYY4_9MICC|nr:hypothetical protein [Arthrobacter pigmenti]NJC23411.1 hypothetical protein [Arthrobacter pigmenti]